MNRLDKKNMVSIFFMILIIGASVASSFSLDDTEEQGWYSSSPLDNRATFYVPSEEYPTIQLAVNNASDGDTIIVFNGSYAVNIFLDKRLTIRSAHGASNCNIQASNSGFPIFTLNKSGSIIDGFTLTGSTGSIGAGIWVSSNNGVIRNNLFSGNRKGIVLRSASNTMIRNNHILNSNEGGISLVQSTSNSIQNNTIKQNNDYGIYLSGNSNSIQNNIIEENTNHGIIASSQHNVFSNNIITNHSQFGIWITGGNNQVLTNTVLNNNYGLLCDGSDSEIKHNIFNENNFYGIYGGIVSNIIILNNTANRNGISGIHLEGTSDSIMSYNTCEDNAQYGFYLVMAHRNHLLENTLKNNQFYGIYMTGANNTIQYNTIEYSNFGILLPSHDTLIDENIINHSFFGISNTGKNNQILNNHLFNNTITAISNGQTLALPFPEYELNLTIKNNTIIKSLRGIHYQSTRVENQTLLLSENNFSEIEEKLIQSWTLYTQVLDEDDEPVTNAFVKIIHHDSNRILFEGYTNDTGYFVDSFGNPGVSLYQYHVSSTDELIHDNPYRFNVTKDDKRVISYLFIENNTEKKIHFEEVNVSISNMSLIQVINNPKALIANKDAALSVDILNSGFNTVLADVNVTFNFGEIYRESGPDDSGVLLKPGINRIYIPGGPILRDEGNLTNAWINEGTGPFLRWNTTGIDDSIKAQIIPHPEMGEFNETQLVMTISKDIVESIDFRVLVVPVYFPNADPPIGENQPFSVEMGDQQGSLLDMFPIEDTRFHYDIIDARSFEGIPPTNPNDFWTWLYDHVTIELIAFTQAHNYDRVVVVLHNEWIEVLGGTIGIAIGILRNPSIQEPVVVINTDIDHTLVAHEIGHTYYLWHPHDIGPPTYGCEMFNVQERIYEKMAMTFMGYPHILPPGVPGDTVWIDEGRYQNDPLVSWGDLEVDDEGLQNAIENLSHVWSWNLFDQLTFQSNSNTILQSTNERGNEPVIIISGILYDNHSFTPVYPWYNISTGKANLFQNETGDYFIIVKDGNKAVLGRYGFSAHFFGLIEDEDSLTMETYNSTSFCFSIPYMNGTHSIEIWDTDDTVLYNKTISAHPPTVELHYPIGGEEFLIGEGINVQWSGEDADDDEIMYTVSYSKDNTHWIPLMINTKNTTYHWNTSFLDAIETYYLQVMGTDGFHTVIDKIIEPITFQSIRANFTFSPLNPSINEIVEFNDTSLSVFTDIINWTWDFGDGNSSYDQNTTHQYNTDGEYAVCLTVMDDEGVIDSVTRTVVVGVPLGPIQNINTGKYFDSIQVAIDDADTLANHMITVAAGIYSENIHINKSISLIGEDKHTTIIDGGGMGTVVSVYSDWVNISGFTVQNSGESWLDSGILLNYSRNNMIKDNIIRDNEVGILLENASDYNMITNNSILSNDYGILIELSYYNYIIGNIITDNNDGISLWATDENIIEGNVITDNNRCGIQMWKGHDNFITNNVIANNYYPQITLWNAHDTTIYGNTILDSGTGIYLRDGSSYNLIQNNTVINHTSDGIEIRSSSNNYVINNSINKSGRNALQMYSSDNNLIEGNNIVDSGTAGIHIYFYSNNNTLRYNVIDNTSGISVDKGDQTKIIGNTITNNRNRGILLWTCTNTNISGNTITNNECGIFLRDNSRRSIISQNIISDNTGYGIQLSSTSTDNTIKNNSITDNGEEGIRLYSNSNVNTITRNIISGNTLEGINISNSNHNLVYNNYLNNTENAYDDGTNIWNISKTLGTNIIGGPYLGGNYWSDYTGEDTTGDGLGETPYNISGGINKDHYPLVPAEIPVGPVQNLDTGNYFDSIQVAIDDAETLDGHTIYVESAYTGTIEHIIITKQISLLGEDKNTTIIDGGGMGNVVLAISDWVNISGFTVQNSGSESLNAGIRLESSSHTTITNTIITNNRNGIGLHSSSNSNTLASNIVTFNTHDGISIHSSHENSIMENSIINNSRGCHASASNNNIISANLLKNNTYNGISTHTSHNNNISYNMVTKNKEGIHLFITSNNNNITDNNIRDNMDVGINISNSNHNLVYNNYLNNTNNAYDDSINTWNITKTLGINIIGGPYLGGNYWSDYTGEDTTGDGLGDTEVPHGPGDYLPLLYSFDEIVSLTVGSTEDGFVSNPGEGTFTYDYGEVVPLVVVTEAGYHFVEWTGDIEKIHDPSAVVTNITMLGDYEILANFALTEVIDVEVVTQPQLTYIEGQELDLSGLQVNLSWSDNTFEMIDFVDFEHNDLTADPEHGTTLTYVDHHGTVVTITHDASGLSNVTDALTVDAVSGPVQNINTSEYFYTIQAAINDDDTLDGHTIFVESTYTGTFENVVITKAVLLTGEDKNTTIIDSGGSGSVITVSSDLVVISGFTVQNSGSGVADAGIKITSNDTIFILNNIITNNHYGVRLESSNNCLIIDNTISNSDRYGLGSTFSNRNMILGNHIVDNGFEGGIWLSSSNNNSIFNNTIRNNTNEGIFLSSSMYNTIMDNNINDNNNGIALGSSSYHNNITDNIIRDNVNLGIHLWDSNHNLVYNNYFNNNNNAWDNSVNQWNITKTEGTNIIGGPYLGGNYWSDYTGGDTTGDGLGDTLLPYNSSGDISNGGDYLPLTLIELCHELQVTIIGNGIIDRDPDKDCYEHSEEVILTPIADLGWFFDSWNGPDVGDLIDNGDGTWNITMTKNNSLIAQFIEELVSCEPEIDLPPGIVDMVVWEFPDDPEFSDVCFKIHLSGISEGFDVHDGFYSGWCVEYGRSIPNNKSINVTLRSSYDDELPDYLHHENWSMVNYILNHKNGTRVDVQRAIFYFLNFGFWDWDKQWGPMSGNVTNETWSMINDTKANVEGWCPDPDGVIAVICDQGSKNWPYQLTIIELSLDSNPNEEPPGESNDGNTGSSQKTTGANINQPPIAVATVDINTGTPGLICTFDASASYDPDGDIILYTWDFDDGALISTKEETISHLFDSVGIYQVMLTVKDNNGATGSLDTPIIVEIVRGNNPPEDLVVTAESTWAHQNTMVMFTMSAVDPDLDDMVCFKIDWGDGNTLVSEYVRSGKECIIGHQWDTYGVYMVSVIAYDEYDGSTAPVTMLIYVDVLVIDDVITGWLIDLDSDGTFDVFRNMDTHIDSMLSKYNESTGVYKLLKINDPSLEGVF